MAQAARDVVEGQSSSSSHRSGGIRRRVADSGAGSGAKNLLIDTLKLKWGKGKVFAKDVKEIIGGATAQGASQLLPLSSPAHPQNFQRSLKAALGCPGGAPRFTWAHIPTTSGDRFHPLLCPHGWFRSLFRERPRLWESSVKGDVGAAEWYWDELQESEVLREHPKMVPSVRLARRCWKILPRRQSHGHQLQLADRLWGHEEPTVFDHRLQEVEHVPWHIGQLFPRDCLVLQRAADWHRATGGLGGQRP